MRSCPDTDINFPLIPVAIIISFPTLQDVLSDLNIPYLAKFPPEFPVLRYLFYLNIPCPIYRSRDGLSADKKEEKSIKEIAKILV